METQPNQPTLEAVEAAFGASSLIARLAREDGNYPTQEAVERRLARGRRQFKSGQRYEARARAEALEDGRAHLAPEQYDRIVARAAAERTETLAAVDAAFARMGGEA